MGSTKSDPLLAQNFAVNVYSAQIESVASQGLDTDVDQTTALLSKLDTIFVIIFAAELATNLYSRWFWPFVRNNWCLFDLFVVSISIIGLLPLGLPFNLLLLFRCCRVLRVFGKFSTIRSLVYILAKSFLPMISAFFIVFLLSSICESCCVTIK